MLQGEGRAARRRRARRGGARGDRALAGAAARRERRLERRRGGRADRARSSANDLELVEQPCATLPELAEVRRRVSTPIAADESITGPDDVRAAAAAGACDAVNVKLASCGGVGRARAAIRARGRRRAWRPFLSSTFDGPWGISAALQLARRGDLPARVRAGDARAVRLAARRAAAAAARRPDAGAAAGPGWASWPPTTTCSPRCSSRKRPSSAATASGCSSCGACPAPGIVRDGAARQQRRHPRGRPRRTSRRARRRCTAPASSSAGSRVPDRRASRPGPRCAAAPRARRVVRRAGRALRRDELRAAGVANTGWRSQRSTTASIGERSIQSASSSSAARARRPGRRCPALTPTSTSARHRVRLGRARRAARAGRPSSSRPARRRARRPARRRLVEQTRCG